MVAGETHRFRKHTYTLMSCPATLRVSKARIPLEEVFAADVSSEEFFGRDPKGSRNTPTIIEVLVQLQGVHGLNKTSYTTVDGKNPAPVDMVNVLSFTGFHTC